MAISNIQDFGVFRPEGLPKGPSPKPGETSGPSFGQALEEALKTTENQMQEGDAVAGAYISGEGVDLHTALLQMERADLSFRTMMEVRNKLLEAYREIMRIPV